MDAETARLIVIVIFIVIIFALCRAFCKLLLSYLAVKISLVPLIFNVFVVLVFFVLVRGIIIVVVVVKFVVTAPAQTFISL